MSIVLNGTTGITTPALDSVAKIAPADLGTGTPDATNFLRGDGSWQVISTTPTTAQVLTATAGASVGAVGTYAFAGTANNASNLAAGTTVAGSSLIYAGINMLDGALYTLATSGGLSGTWRAMGFKPARGNDFSLNREVTLWLRIS